MIDKEAHALLGLAGACCFTVSNVKVIETASCSEQMVQALKDLQGDLKSLLTKKEVAGYRKQLELMGYVSRMPANERLITHFVAKGPKAINNIVDSYNFLTLKYGASIGVHCGTNLSCDIRVSRAKGMEAIRPLCSEKAKKIKTGDLCYSCAGKPIASIGKLDVDSDEHKVTATTESLVILILGNADTAYEYNRNISVELIDLIRNDCPALTYQETPVIFE